ncbi:MAG: RIO1 family regulatory kinase/ATPase [Anaerolineales bacterium]
MNQLSEFFEELDDSSDETSNRAQKRVSQRRESQKREMEAKLFIRAQEISRDFQFTYKAARFEEVWLLGSLVEIYEQEWVSDVLRKVKGGKEASVYLCKAGPEIPSAEWVAAKIYRPRMLRNLRNDGMYRADRADLDASGSQVTDKRQLRAMRKKTEYGRELLHQSWIAYEFTTLGMLHRAGADVPEPYTMAENAILMEFVGDGSISAPTLSEVDLELPEAKSLFERVMRNMEILLAHDRIHGDLSAYNILYWQGDITLIDFPQVVSPKSNKNAFKIFSRDVTRVCDYFIKQGMKLDPVKLSSELWDSHSLPIYQPDPVE